ncbi:hypothetical protein ALP65_01104 [Pseudomonas aeruginosa]|uniref:Globin domain-containing protein n=1 Tax=Pseudomonas aeruginosa TaxID=287 RepID=A0A3M5DBT2_PSEAI|nr:hypothetical protein ALP65_01104 [Pseudomonas aeruginosa]
MLSNAQRALIKATVPLLETGGEALITHFYRTMLGEYPEVRPLFNQAHQASGDQPRALANGVLMYARHIDQLQELGPLVAKVVNKHVSLQVLPEHYPIVGTCLLRAIREVLGEQIATDEVLEAWGAAYQQLADLLIEAEESVYAASAQADGGWRGVRRFRVARKQAESEEITSFYLEPVDGQPLLALVLLAGEGVLGTLLGQLGLEHLDRIAAGIDLGLLGGGVDLDQQLAFRHIVPGLDVQLADLPGGLGADVDVAPRLQGAERRDAALDAAAADAHGVEAVAAERIGLPGGQGDQGAEADCDEQCATSTTGSSHSGIRPVRGETAAVCRAGWRSQVYEGGSG